MSEPAKPIQGLPEHPYTDAAVQLAAQTSPLAGGQTYTPEYTREDADVIVSESSEWGRADRNGVVYIADGETVDVSGLGNFDLDGTVVCGGRHKPNTEPGMVVDNEGGPGSASYDGIFRAENQAGHVEGIRIRGPTWYPERAGRYEQESPSDARCWPGYHHIEKSGTRSERDEKRSAVFGRGVYLWPAGSTVRNCDIHGFIHAGVSVGAAQRVPENIEITHNQIHNCCTPGLGYPINIYNGYVLSKWNYFNAYRHSITGFGHPTCGYISRYDVHGPDALLSPVDMHNLAENGGSSGDLTAGDYVHVDRSTFLGEYRFETPGWYSKDDQPAIGIRGTPEDGIYVMRSQFMQPGADDAFMEVNVSGFDRWHTQNNEFGEENWTADQGVGIDFDDVDGGEQGGSVPHDRHEAIEAQARALARHLQRLQTHATAPTTETDANADAEA